MMWPATNQSNILIVLPAVAERARVEEEDIEGGDDDLDTRPLLPLSINGECVNCR